MGNRSKARRPARSQPASSSTRRSRPKRRRVARDVDDGAQRRRQRGHGAHHRGPGPLPRRVEHEGPGSADARGHEAGRHRGPPDLERGEVAPVVPGVLAGAPVVLDGEDPAARSGRLPPAGSRRAPRRRRGRRHRRPDGRRHRREPHRAAPLAHRHGPARRLPDDVRNDRPATSVSTAAGGRRTVPSTTRPASQRASRRGGPGPGTAARRDGDEGAPAGLRPARRDGAGDHLDLGRSWPPRGEHAGRDDGGIGDGAVGDRLHVVGPVAAEAGPPVTVHRQPYPAAPAEAAMVPRDGLHLHGPLHAGEPPQLLLHAGRLQAALGLERHVLVVAAAAATRPGVRAGRFDPVGRPGEHLHRVGPRVRRGHGRDPCPHPFTRKGVAHEDHPAAVVAGHAPAAPGDRPRRPARARSRLGLGPGPHGRWRAHLPVAPSSPCRAGQRTARTGSSGRCGRYCRSGPSSIVVLTEHPDTRRPECVTC